MTLIMMVIKLIRVGAVEKLGSITDDSYESWEQHTVANDNALLGECIMQKHQFDRYFGSQKNVMRPRSELKIL